MIPLEHALLAALLITGAGPREPADSWEARCVSPDHSVVVVHGTVRDYRGRAVADASVSSASQYGSVSVQTDGSGGFTIRVPAGAHVVAIRGDMLGTIDVGDAAEQTVVIIMTQGPM